MTILKTTGFQSSARSSKICPDTGSCTLQVASTKTYKSQLLWEKNIINFFEHCQHKNIQKPSSTSIFFRKPLPSLHAFYRAGRGYQLIFWTLYFVAFMAFNFFEHFTSWPSWPSNYHCLNYKCRKDSLLLRSSFGSGKTRRVKNKEKAIQYEQILKIQVRLMEMIIDHQLAGGISWNRMREIAFDLEFTSTIGLIYIKDECNPPT